MSKKVSKPVPIVPIDMFLPKIYHGVISYNKTFDRYCFEDYKGEVHAFKTFDEAVKSAKFYAMLQADLDTKFKNQRTDTSSVW